MEGPCPCPLPWTHHHGARMPSYALRGINLLIRWQLLPLFLPAPPVCFALPRYAPALTEGPKHFVTLGDLKKQKTY